VALQSTLTASSVGLLKGGPEAADIRRDLTPVKAWTEGTNLRAAIKADATVMRTWLALQLARLCKDVGVNNTLQTAEELGETCDAIIEEFPALKVEEVVLVFKQISRGRLLPNLYGALRTRQLLDAFRAYEGEQRADVLEKHHKAPRDPALQKRGSDGRPRFKPILATEQDLKDLGIWPEENK